MNELLEKVNSVVGPMIVPLPLSEKYISSIILSDGIFIHNIQLQKNKEVASADFMSLNATDLHKYILDMILKTPESIVIYNDIKKERVYDFNVYHLYVNIISGNKKFEYRYLTENPTIFINCLEKYILSLYDNKLNSLADELQKMNNYLDINKGYKLKTKRKTLINNI